MDERFCEAGEVTLCYETFGDPGDPTILLVMGLGVQMLGWRAELCEMLAERGYRVVRFDNRDTGRSTRIAAPPPTLGQILRRSRAAAPYLLSDMAADAVGLLDCLGVDSAHVVGASMGGMIAQTMAARHQDRVRSLVSIMSTTGSRVVGQPHLRLYPVLVRAAPHEREAFVEHIAKTFALIGSPGFPRDEDDLREMAATSFDRGHDSAGTARQLMAILASGNRTAELRRISVPTVVVHGTKDRLVAPSGGRATARAIRGARLVRVEGMGHDLPRGAWPQLVDETVANAQRADGAAEQRRAA